MLNWSNKSCFDFYCLWEELNNENFNFTTFREIKINEISKNQYTILQGNNNIKKSNLPKVRFFLLADVYQPSHQDGKYTNHDDIPKYTSVIP